MDKGRNDNFDLMRLVAAFFVIFIHVNFDESTYSEIDFYFKSLLRWCVPLFFLLTGYFLSGNGMLPTVSLKKITTIFKIAIVANLTFLPLILLSNRESINFENFLSGAWFHLWFLNSMIVGLLFIRLLTRLGIHNSVLFIISFLIIIIFHIADFLTAVGYYSENSILIIGRFLQSFPLILIGYLLKKSEIKLNPTFCQILLFVGVILCFFELKILKGFGAGDVNPQFPIGTLFMTFGVFGIFQNLKIKNSLLSKVGREYSLFIYILHPIFLTSTKYLGYFLGLNENHILYISLFFTPVISIFVIAYATKIFPFYFELLSGRWDISNVRKGS